MCSWRWVIVTPETRRAVVRYNKLCDLCIFLELYTRIYVFCYDKTVGFYLLGIFVSVVRLISLYFIMFHNMRVLFLVKWSFKPVSQTFTDIWRYLHANWISDFKYVYYILNWKPEVFIESSPNSNNQTYSLVFKFRICKSVHHHTFK